MAVASARVTVKFASNWIRQVSGKADPKLRAAAETIADYQRAHIPGGSDESNGRRPGYARSRIQVRVVAGDNGLKSYEVGSDATSPDGFPYPVVLDVGAAPHEIQAQGDYSLHNSQTNQYFGRTVQHPGVHGNHWCTDSLNVIHGLSL